MDERSTVSWTPARTRRLVVRAAPLVIVPAIVFAVVVAAVDSARRQTTYHSQAQVAVAQSQPLAPTPSQVARATTSSTVLLATNARAGTRLDLAELQSALGASSDAASGVLTLTAQRPDAASAAALANAYASVFRETLDKNVRGQLERRQALIKSTISHLRPKSGDLYNSLVSQELNLQGSLDTPAATLVNSASVPVGVTTGIKRDVAAALLLGALLGIGIAGLREVVARRLDDAEEIGARLGVAVVGSSDGEEDIALAATLLEQQLGGSGVLCFVGADDGAGAEEVAAAVASSMARAGRETMIVDADIRGLGPHDSARREGPGVADVATGAATSDDVIARAHRGEAHLVAVPAGAPVEGACDVLRGNRFGAFLSELAARAEIVAVRAPSFPAVAEAAAVAVRSDGVVVVVRSRSLTAPQLDELRGVLALLPARKLGVVVTRVAARRQRKEAPATARGLHPVREAEEGGKS